MSRRTKIVWLLIAVLLVAVVAALPRIGFFRLTGRFTPVHKIESLQAPVAVKGWTPDGLSLSDGRVVSLPGVHALPSVSAALSEMTKRGVKVTRDGRVYGLVRIHQHASDLAEVRSKPPSGAGQGIHARTFSTLGRRLSVREKRKLV